MASKGNFRHATTDIAASASIDHTPPASSLEEASTSGRFWAAASVSASKAVWNSGMTCMAIASLLQSMGALCVKLTDGRIPVFELVAVRSGICMVVTIGMIKWGGITPIFGHRENYVYLVVRGAAGAASMSLYYFAILVMPLADVMTVFYTHPALVVALAWLCRGEAVSWTGLLGMFLSLLGVVVVAQPPFLAGGTEWTSQHVEGVVDSLLAALMAAVAFVAIRFMRKSESSLSIALSFHTMGVITSIIPLAAGIPSFPVLPGLKDWGYLCTIATCSFTSHAFIARAFQVENAAKSAAAGYLQVVFGYLFGIFIFHDPHNLLGILGSATICIGVLAVSWPSKPAPTSETEASKPDEPIDLEMAPLIEAEEASKQPTKS